MSRQDKIEIALDVGFGESGTLPVWAQGGISSYEADTYRVGGSPVRNEVSTQMWLLNRTDGRHDAKE